MDITDLIKRLRSNDRDVMCKACRPAADALEVQAKRIAELEVERDEARDAVKRLAGALEELANDAEYAMRSNDEAIARDALSDPVVKRIVEGV